MKLKQQKIELIRCNNQSPNLQTNHESVTNPIDLNRELNNNKNKHNVMNKIYEPNRRVIDSARVRSGKLERERIYLVIWLGGEWYGGEGKEEEEEEEEEGGGRERERSDGGGHGWWPERDGSGTVQILPFLKGSLKLKDFPFALICYLFFCKIFLSFLCAIMLKPPHPSFLEWVCLSVFWVWMTKLKPFTKNFPFFFSVFIYMFCWVL